MDRLEARLSRLRRLALAVYVAIGCVIVLSTIRLALQADYLAGTDLVWQVPTDYGPLIDLALLFEVLALFISYVVVAFWIYRAHANLRDRDVEGLEFSPGWAVGWYAIPIANLFKPFQAMSELYRVSRQTDTVTAPTILYVWWIPWVLTSFIPLANWGNWEERSLFDSATSACTLVSATCLLVIIRRITNAQQAEPLAEVFA